MKTLNYKIVLVSLMGLIACQSEELDEFNATPNDVQIEVSVGEMVPRSNPTGDEITSAQFNTGDRIAMNTEDQATVVYTFNGNKWVPEEGKFLKWNKPQHDFCAYYPAETYTGIEDVPTEQSDADKIVSADYMSFTQTVTKPANATLKLEMQRQTSRIVINEAQFTWGNQYRDGDNVVYEVKNILVHCEGGNGIIDITPYKASGKYYALVNPGTANANAPFITLTVAPKPGQSGTEEQLIVRGIPEHKAGISYNCRLTLGKDKAELNKVTLEDWGAAEYPWSGTASNGYTVYDTYYAGKGYDIYTLDGLLAVNELMANGTKDDVFNAIITLHDDFVLPAPAPGESNWTPLGLYEETPEGDIKDWYVTEFNGNGHKITGLVINNPDKDYQGFLGNCSKVSNLTLEGCTVIGNKKVGGIAGFCQEIENCTVKATAGHPVIIDGADGYVGGIVGHNMRFIKNSTLTNTDNASVTITVSGQASRAGGIVGMSQGTITNCHVTNTGGEFIVKNYNGNQTGGLVGQNENIISNSSVTGVTIDGFASVGGFIGSNGPLGRFTDDKPGNAKPTNTITGCTIIGYITNMTGLIYGDNMFIDWTLTITDGGGNTVNGIATK